MPPISMQIGQRVRVRGLVNKPHFNGMEGTIINTLYSQKGFCWVYHVKLDKGGKKLLFKDSNIEVIGAGVQNGVGEQMMYEDMEFEPRPRSQAPVGSQPTTNGYYTQAGQPSSARRVPDSTMPGGGFMARPPLATTTPQGHGIQTRQSRAKTFSSGQTPPDIRLQGPGPYRDSYLAGLPVKPRPQKRLSRGRNLSFDSQDHSTSLTTSFDKNGTNFDGNGSFGSQNSSQNRAYRSGVSPNPPLNGRRGANVMSPRVQALQREYNKPQPVRNRNPSQSSTPNHSRNHTISGATGAYLGALGF